LQRGQESQRGDEHVQDAAISEQRSDEAVLADVPDAGGDVRAMTVINEAYEYLLSRAAG
jgi:hypothetical protein